MSRTILLVSGNIHRNGDSAAVSAGCFSYWIYLWTTIKGLGMEAFLGCSDLEELTVVNKKLKFLYDEDENENGVFDGPSSGYLRDTITIKGDKGSTAEKLAKQMNERDPYANPVRRFEKIKYKAMKE